MNTDDIRNIKWTMRSSPNTTMGKIFTTRELGEALNKLRETINNDGLKQYIDRLEGIEEDYRLMKDFIRRGFNDPKREEVYNNLLKRTYHLYNDTIVAYAKRNTSGLNYYSPFAVATMPLDDIRQRLESFVQDTALLSLDPSATNEEKKKTIYTEHHELTTALFYHLMTDTHWNEETKAFYQELLLSPTIDSMDAQLLTSALLLALLLAFDARKFATLLYLYQYATDPQVKQRALVGWALTLPREEILFYPDLIEQLNKTVSSQAVQRELLELQYQIVYCIDAEKATQEINRDIIPTMMRGQNIVMGNQTDEQKLQDIINPDAEEQAMEELEKSYTRMMDMQQKGVDVYFGGFSQMKRFPFFNRANNWFMPFYTEHPELKPLEGFDESRLEQNIFEHSSFCNSDKYSLALAMAMIAKQIPPELKNAINANGLEIQGNMVVDKDNPAYIRRMYLQDLYRFFFLNNLKEVFDNPFQGDGIAMHGLFFNNQLLGHTGVSAHFTTFGKFLLRKGLGDLLRLFTKGQGSDATIVSDEWLYLCAMAAMHAGDYEKAKSYFANLMESLPEDEKMIQGYVEACMLDKDFDHAEKHLERLYKLGSITPEQELFLAEGQMQAGKVKKASEILFKLNYEQPDNIQAKRLLAQNELWLNKPESAIDILNSIISNADVATNDDYFYAAIAHWFVNDIQKAIELFTHTLRKWKVRPDDVPKGLANAILRIDELTKKYQRSLIDIRILTDIVADEMRADESPNINND